MTPLEHLKIFGSIKGLEGEDLETAIDFFIHKIDLDLFKNTASSNLSGGNKRKLCISMSLIGGPIL